MAGDTVGGLGRTADGGGGEGLAGRKRWRGEHGERRAQGEGERSGKEERGVGEIRISCGFA